MLGILALVAGLVVLVGWVWTVFLAFSEDGALWGIICLIFSPVALIWGAINFSTAKVPLLMMIGGIVVQLAAGMMMGPAGIEGMETIQVPAAP